MTVQPAFIYWSASRIAAAIRSKEITSVEIVEACLSRIETINPIINAAVQVVADRALREAQHLDKMANQDKFKGPLHGVPISIKDSLDTEGIVTTGGTLGRRHFVPSEDAPVVARLRDAGAVLIAKTNTPELTLDGETDNLIYGRTSNPFDPSRSPGGSSGGSVALVAAGGSALELGSDTGGSIREPAHLCGVVGIKPTSGRTPRTGHIIPYGTGVLDSLTQIGPIARYVDDLELALNLICGPDGRDPSVVPMPPISSSQIDPGQLRIAYYTDNGVVPLESDIKRVVLSTVDTLIREGLKVEYARLPEIPKMAELLTEFREAAMEPAIRRLLKRYNTSQTGPALDRYMKGAGSNLHAGVDTALLESIDELRSKALIFMQDFDAVICPPSHALARPHGASWNDNYEHWSHVTIHNMLGWPGAVVRAGTSEKDALPVGVQIVAAPWQEDNVLALAREVESLMGGYQAPEV